jgi:hypothetical protein
MTAPAPQWPPGPAGPPGRGGTRLLVAGVVLIAAAVAVGVVGVLPLLDVFRDGAPTRVREVLDLELDEPTELTLYRITGEGSGAGSCAVRAPDGEELPVGGVVGRERLTINGVEHLAVGRVDAPEAGTYRVVCTGAGFAIGPRVGIVGAVFAVLGGVFGGLALAVGGVVCLVLGIDRRRRPPAPPWGVPPQG